MYVEYQRPRTLSDARDSRRGHVWDHELHAGVDKVPAALPSVDSFPALVEFLQKFAWTMFFHCYGFLTCADL